MIIRRIVVDDGRTKRDVPLVGTITVGRDPACQVSDPDPLLSRRHAEFVATSREVTIRDLGSRNGVLVNGTKVPERVLAPGDLVQIGRLHCQYVEETASAAEPPQPKAAAPVPPPIVHDRTIAIVPSDLPIDVPLTPFVPLPTGNEPTFVPAGWRAEAMQGFDDTQPDRTPAEDDTDLTRRPGSLSLTDLGLKDFDVTGALTRVNFEALARDNRDEGHDDETMAPRGGARPQATPANDPPPIGPGQARLVTGPSLLVSEASASGLDVFGMTPQSLVGASIPDLVVRALSLMAAGDGPTAVSLTVERRDRDGHLTVTFTAPPAQE